MRKKSVNIAARNLRDPRYRPQTVKSKKIYSRKGKAGKGETSRPLCTKAFGAMIAKT